MMTPGIPLSNGLKVNYEAVEGEHRPVAFAVEERTSDTGEWRIVGFETNTEQADFWIDRDPTGRRKVALYRALSAPVSDPEPTICPKCGAMDGHDPIDVLAKDCPEHGVSDKPNEPTPAKLSCGCAFCEAPPVLAIPYVSGGNMTVSEDTKRLDWMHRHYAQFVCAVTTIKGGEAMERTTIRWSEVEREKWESGELDYFDDGKREQELAGDFRAAIDTAMEATT